MMIQPTPEYSEFCRRQMADETLSYEQARRIYESLHREALALSAISSANIWNGFEVDLRVAKAINGRCLDNLVDYQTLAYRIQSPAQARIRSGEF